MNNCGSWKLEAGSWQKRWGGTLIFLCVLALAPLLSANDDGEIVDASIVLTISPDYKVKEEVSITKRLLSYQALDTDGDPRTPYCGALQTLTITRARVTTPGGKVVDCTPIALNLSTPDALVAHPALSSWQEMVVTFLGLEPGAQTELSYIREDKSAFRTTFEKKQILAWHFPIRKGTVTVRLPKDMKLTYQIMNFKGEAAANAVADLMEYTFTFKDIPAFSDRDMHNGVAFLPTLYLTTTPSWEAAGKRLQEIAEKYGSPDEAITKKAQELTKDATTDLDKAIAIHKFVKENFKEIEWPLQDSLLLFNDASKTFQMGQGTELELALLLCSMMKAIGGEEELRPGLVLTGELPEPDKAPGLMAFDRILAHNALQLWDAKGSASLEPTGRFLLRQGYKVFPPASVREQGAVVLRGEVELQKEKFSGSATIGLYGTFSFSLYWKNLEEKGALEDTVKAFLPLPALKIDEIQVKHLDEQDIRLDIKFSGTTREGDRTIRLLPESKAFLPGIDSRVEVAALPVRLPDIVVSVKWTIKGAGMVEPLDLKPIQRAGEINIVRKPADDGYILEAKLSFGLETLAPADYPALQAALAAWQNPVVAGVLLP